VSRQGRAQSARRPRQHRQSLAPAARRSPICAKVRRLQISRGRSVNPRGCRSSSSTCGRFGHLSPPQRKPVHRQRGALPTCHISDQTGSAIPGAQSFGFDMRPENPWAAQPADSAGAYQVRGLPAGSYVVQSSYQGFAPFVSAPDSTEHGSVKSKAVDIKMAIEAADVQVVVTDEGAPERSAPIPIRTPAPSS